jgi:SAM-dependent methyltransferase
MSILGERILLALSRDRASGDYSVGHYEEKHQDVDVYIAILRRTFPGMDLEGKKVLDIGCAEGMETLALSMMGAAEVHGIDIRIDAAQNKAIVEAHPDRAMRFSVMDAEATTFPDGEFDVAVTCGSFEHFLDPAAVLRETMRVVKPGGMIYVTSSVWAHPWGAHMNFFTRVPWVQFLFSERTIMAVRRRYRDDGATRFHEVEGGLNKVGVKSFQRIVRSLGLEVHRFHLTAVKGLRILTRLPLVRELFSSLIVVELRVPERAGSDRRDPRSRAGTARRTASRPAYL